MKITIITLFPEVFDNVLSHSILGRAQKKGLVEYKLLNHRDFGIGNHKVVDDKPYGGGAGMLLKVDVLKKAIDTARLNIAGEKVVLLDPQGKKYQQSIAESFSKLKHLILVCGHYEGFDARIKQYVDLEISVGDYVLTGGEIPAMAIIDSITRLIPGVLKDPEATRKESFSESSSGRILEGDQYTRPEIFEGVAVPPEYLSGNPIVIDEVKLQTGIEKTTNKRPDLKIKAGDQ